MSRIITFVALIAGVVGSTAAEEPQVSPLESKYLSQVRQVTRGFVKAGEGYFSPDGKTIIYQAIPQEYPFYQIYTQPLKGGEPKLISTGRGRTTCAYFSPNGERILFSSSHLDPDLAATEAKARRQQEEDRKSGQRRRYSWDFDPYMDIFDMPREGGALRQLTDARGYDAEGAWSPNGNSIAFCSDRDGDPDIYLMDANGSNVRQLTNASGYDGGPFISPDNQWVVFRSDRKKESYLQIYVIGVDGKQEQALTDNEGVNWGPYWHPTQPYLIWSGADHSNPNARPNYDLWMTRYEIKEGKFQTSKPIRVTDSAAADVLPVFSPDGKQLMWTSTRTEDRESQLFICDFTLPETP